jgi:hypothetical protein
MHRTTATTAIANTHSHIAYKDVFFTQLARHHKKATERLMYSLSPTCGSVYYSSVQVSAVR